MNGLVPGLHPSRTLPPPRGLHELVKQGDGCVCMGAVIDASS